MQDIPSYRGRWRGDRRCRFIFVSTIFNDDNSPVCHGSRIHIPCSCPHFSHSACKLHQSVWNPSQSTAHSILLFYSSFPKRMVHGPSVTHHDANGAIDRHSVLLIEQEIVH